MSFGPLHPSSASPSVVAFLDGEYGLKAHHKTLLTRLFSKSDRIIALDSYLTSSYIPSTSEKARKAKSNPDDYPIRFLANTAPNGPPKLVSPTTFTSLPLTASDLSLT